MRFIRKKATMTFLVLFGLSSCVFQHIWGYDTVHADRTSEINVVVEGKLDYEMAVEILVLVNKERSIYGLDPLSLTESEVKSAEIRAKECILRYSHRRPVSGDWVSLVSSGRSHVGENLAAGYNTAESVVQAWMNSPSHRANILGADYNSMGVSVFKYNNPLTDKRTCVIAQHFSSVPGEEFNSQKTITDFEISVDTDVYPLNMELYIDKLNDDKVLSLMKGDVVKPFVKINADDMWDSGGIFAEPRTLEWNISEPSVVEMTDAGYLKALKSGTTTVQVTASGSDYTSDFEIVVKKSICLANINFPNPQKYTGNIIEPKITIDDNGQALTEGVDYKLVYSDNTYVGTAHIHVQGIGEYGSESVIHFSIYDETTAHKDNIFKKIYRFLKGY